jgi:RNA polymerase-interacting CarD/CdnL/TRCF family regulator
MNGLFEKKQRERRHPGKKLLVQKNHTVVQEIILVDNVRLTKVHPAILQKEITIAEEVSGERIREGEGVKSYIDY